MNPMFLQQFTNGIMLGSIYAIVALGYTLIFGVLDIINMAQGSIFMFGAFVGMIVVMTLHAPLVVAFCAAILTAALLGYLLDLIAVKPLGKDREASHLNSLISTLGVAIALENLALHIFGSGNQPFRTEFAEYHFQIGNVTFYLVQIIILSVAVFIMIGLHLWLSTTRTGRALRATAENPDIAGLLGVNTRQIVRLTVIVASVMGGIAGVLVGMAFNFINIQMGLTMGFKGLAIIILGGMGNIKGAIAGGLILGLAETFVVVYGSSSYQDVIPFVIIILILLIKPQGLFGKNMYSTGQ